MQTAHITIPFRKQSDTFRLWFLSDMHLGSKLCDEARLRADIAQIRVDENARAFLLGDVCDYIAVSDWRYERDGIADWVDDSDVGNSQVRYALKIFEPIAGKILGAIQGNHERTMEREYNNNVHKNLCEDLGILNLGYSAMVRLTFRRGNRARGGNSGEYRPLDIWLHHGYGGGRTIGADANRFSEAQRGYRADLYVAGHTHQRHASKSVQYEFNPLADDLLPRVKMICRAGTYLRTTTRNVTSYSERAGFVPLTTGALCVTFCPYTRDLISSV